MCVSMHLCVVQCYPIDRKERDWKQRAKHVTFVSNAHYIRLPRDHTAADVRSPLQRAGLILATFAV